MLFRIESRYNSIKSRAAKAPLDNKDLQVLPGLPSRAARKQTRERSSQRSNRRRSRRSKLGEVQNAIAPGIQFSPPGDVGHNWRCSYNHVLTPPSLATFRLPTLPENSASKIISGPQSECTFAAVLLVGTWWCHCAER